MPRFIVPTENIERNLLSCERWSFIWTTISVVGVILSGIIRISGWDPDEIIFLGISGIAWVFLMMTIAKSSALKLSLSLLRRKAFESLEEEDDGSS